jgi:hypothetical protein
MDLFSPKVPISRGITFSQHPKIETTQQKLKYTKLEQLELFGQALKPSKDFHHIHVHLNLNILSSTSTNCPIIFFYVLEI